MPIRTEYVTLREGTVIWALPGSPKEFGILAFDRHNDKVVVRHTAITEEQIQIRQRIEKCSCYMIVTWYIGTGSRSLSLILFALHNFHGRKYITTEHKHDFGCIIGYRRALIRLIIFQNLPGFEYLGTMKLHVSTLHCALYMRIILRICTATPTYMQDMYTWCTYEMNVRTINLAQVQD